MGTAQYINGCLIWRVSLICTNPTKIQTYGRLLFSFFIATNLVSLSWQSRQISEMSAIVPSGVYDFSHEKQVYRGTLILCVI